MLFRDRLANKLQKLANVDSVHNVHIITILTHHTLLACSRLILELMVLSTVLLQQNQAWEIISGKSLWTSRRNHQTVKTDSESRSS